MKKLVLFLFLISFVSASVDVYNYTVETNYAPSDYVEGEVNLSIDGEDYDSLIDLSKGASVELGGFLEDNGVSFDCVPSDCSEGYSYSDGKEEGSIAPYLLEDKYIGFVLTGGNIELKSMDFKMSSDFERGVTRPLKIQFFENGDWEFSEFSEEFLLKDWGCFDSINKKVGPLVGNSFYCEMIEIEDTDILKVGADVTGSGDELNMIVYPESGSGASWECSFDPSVEDGCLISADYEDIFSSGSYQVCVGAEELTEYHIYKDEDSDNCGFAYDDGPEDSDRDYGIFAQGVMYEDASDMGEISFEDEYIEGANDLISYRYDNDCSDGCILPLRVSGVAQNFRIYDVSLTYTDDSEWQSSNLVYELERDSAEVSFSGILDLGLLGMKVSETGKHYAELAGEYLFNEYFDILPAPVVIGVLPKEAPAGVPVNFYASVDFDSNKSLTYSWDFGDGEEVETSVPYTIHTYEEIGNNSVTVRVSAGGDLESEKEFSIEVISPEEAIDERLGVWGIALSEVRRSLDLSNPWYKEDLFDLIELDILEDELARIGRERNNSFDDEDFKEVAIKLYQLDVPTIVSSNNFQTPFLPSEIEDVNIDPVAIISGSVTGATNEAYAKPVLTWQNENMDVSVSREEVTASYWSGESSNILTAYKIDIVSRSSQEAYFIINRQLGDLYFKENVGERKAGDATAIIISPGESVSAEFYYKDDATGSFFISPKLSSIVVEASVDTSCNFDLICDEDAGENSKNCRSDCKPVGAAITFFVLGLLFIVVIYTILQIWYKKYYEGYLFKDKAQLYNLLMYVTNARARGTSEEDIENNLRAQGWSDERVEYVLRKSVGKSVKMIEIIPIEKISAWLRNRKAKKAALQAKTNNIPQAVNRVPQNFRPRV